MDRVVDSFPRSTRVVPPGTITVNLLANFTGVLDFRLGLYERVDDGFDAFTDQSLALVLADIHTRVCAYLAQKGPPSYPVGRDWSSEVLSCLTQIAPSLALGQLDGVGQQRPLQITFLIEADGRLLAHVTQM